MLAEIRLFHEETPKLLDRVAAAVQSADAHQLRHAAHALRGLLSAFSIHAADAALVVEQTRAEGRAHEAVEPSEIVNRAVHDLSIALATLSSRKVHELANSKQQVK